MLSRNFFICPLYDYQNGVFLSALGNIFNCWSLAGISGVSYRLLPNIVTKFQVFYRSSQIDFATETFFALWGRGVPNNVSQILATVNFSSGEIDGKLLSVWKNFIGNINLGQTSRLNVDKFGIGTVRINCRLTRLGQDSIIRVVCFNMADNGDIRVF